MLGRLVHSDTVLRNSIERVDGDRPKLREGFALWYGLRWLAELLCSSRSSGISRVHAQTGQSCLRSVCIFFAARSGADSVSSIAIDAMDIFRRGSSAFSVVVLRLLI
jgi:hypothetical protein